MLPDHFDATLSGSVSFLWAVSYRTRVGGSEAGTVSRWLPTGLAQLGPSSFSVGNYNILEKAKHILTGDSSHDTRASAILLAQHERGQFRKFPTYRDTSWVHGTGMYAFPFVSPTRCIRRRVLGANVQFSVLGAKANPISTLTGISHEKLNIWHNWVAWAMFVLALVHTFPFIVFHKWKGDLVKSWNDGGTWVTGVIALLAQAWLTFMSIRRIRLVSPSPYHLNFFLMIEMRQ